MNGRARAAGWVLLALGVLGGIETQPTPRRAPLQSGGYTVLAADFHVHSFPGDGVLPPWDIAREADRRGLDVVALTNHNHMLSWKLAQIVPVHPAGAMLIRGEELTAVGYHMAAVGVRDTVSWRQPPADAARAIRQQGGVSIAAHPAGPQSRRYDAAAFAALDGVEAAHPMIYQSEGNRRQLEEFRMRALAARPSLAVIGSTDFHGLAPIGLCRTFVFATEFSEAAVLDAIRAGRTVACDATGHTYGPASLSAAVADACRAAAGSPPNDVSRHTTAGAVLLWLGLLLLVSAGADEAGLE